MRPLVLIVHTETGLRQETVDAVREQYPDYRTALTSSRDPFAYGDVLRTAWRWWGDLVIIEQDVVPPPGAIPKLLECPHSWCTHPHWMGDHFGTETTGLVHWSVALRYSLPHLMDVVCAAENPRYWVRRGWTNIPRDCSIATLNKHGRRATLRRDAPAIARRTDPMHRPTTHDWHGIDADLARQLRGVLVHPHIHTEPTTHLHDWNAVPPGSYVPWPLRPYNPDEWPD